MKIGKMEVRLGKSHAQAHKLTEVYSNKLSVALKDTKSHTPTRTQTHAREQTQTSTQAQTHTHTQTQTQIQT